MQNTSLAPGDRRKLSAKIATKLLLWFVFGATFSLCPLAFLSISKYIHGHGLGLSHLIETGDLLVVSCSLTAAAIGELAASDSKQKNLKLACIGFAMAVIVLTAGVYAMALNANTVSSTSMDLAAFSFTSYIAMLGCFVLSLACLIVSEIP